eukprot:TRINITY_DN3151_c0_g1_i1.p1 TRINITY_DN3151_c0_g1~~TRINITY_DN3151_c0_g1_i1.p1  ORF type:complete len:117 (+),score=10.90 TRINITY_DN3151_c0_g1_i1:37-387(+)
MRSEVVQDCSFKWTSLYTGCGISLARTSKSHTFSLFLPPIWTLPALQGSSTILWLLRMRTVQDRGSSWRFHCAPVSKRWLWLDCRRHLDWSSQEAMKAGSSGRHGYEENYNSQPIK